MRCRYNAVNFHLDSHTSHPKACPLGRDMGCIMCDLEPWFISCFSPRSAVWNISCNIGSRYNGIPLYIYLTYTLCIMAVILQTRCFQMDNCEPDLSFSKYVELDCFRWLYIYGHICDFLSRNAQLKEYIFLQSEQPGGIGTKWRQQDPGNRTEAGVK